MIVARADAPLVRGEAQTVWEHHCFVCHCFIDEGTRQHQRHHQQFRETKLTARSHGEALKMIDFLEISLGAHVVLGMEIWTRCEVTGDPVGANTGAEGEPCKCRTCAA